MEELIYFVVAFCAVYFIYLFFIILKNKNLLSYRNSTEIRLLERLYRVNVDKVGVKKLAHILALCNAFIVSFTVFLIGFFESFLVKMLAGVVFVVPLILGVYYIIGKIYQNRK